MTQDQKIIRAKVGLLELAKQLGNVSQACKMMGYSRGQLLPLQGVVRLRWRAGAAGDQPPQAGVKEPHRTGNRAGGGRVGDRAAGLGPGAGVGDAEAARRVDIARRGALRVAAPRSDVDETPPQGPRSQSGAGWHSVDRSSDRRPREG